MIHVRFKEMYNIHYRTKVSTVLLQSIDKECFKPANLGDLKGFALVSLARCIHPVITLQTYNMYR